MPDAVPLRFSLVRRFKLPHAGGVLLLALDGNRLWAEEMYGDQWMAQHCLDLDGGIIESADEDAGRAANLKPLSVPADSLAPRRAWAAMRLNYTGPRHRGLREEDRLTDILHAISVADKFALAGWLNLPPPAVLGVAESYVLAECPLAAPDDLLLCRRLRVAVAVPRQMGDDGLPFDYETRAIFVLQRWTAGDDEPPLESALAGLGGVPLRRPMDCLRRGDRLYVAEGGETDQPSAISIIEIRGLPAPPDREAELLKKLYG
ncbi:MAG: hypothetical protein JNL34_07280 [Anaerolineae bacterium]|nr:hypothetical protein [Anaerolineae bacterium]